MPWYFIFYRQATGHLYGARFHLYLTWFCYLTIIKRIKQNKTVIKWIKQKEKWSSKQSSKYNRKKQIQIHKIKIYSNYINSPILLSLEQKQLCMWLAVLWNWIHVIVIYTPPEVLNILKKKETIHYILTFISVNTTKESILKSKQK